MEKRHRCKLCFRNFANGRALGGHMRSHMMKFYDEAKKKQQYDDDDDDNDSQSIHSFSSLLSSSSSSSSSSEEESEEVKAVLVDHSDFYVAAALQDRESETESSMKTRKKIIKRSQRSKRVSKSRVSDFDGFFQVKKKSKLEEEEEEEEKKGKNSYDQSSLSSISDTTPEEHVAHCLIMLSRDKWGRAEVESHGEAEEEDDFGDCKEKKLRDSGVRKVIKTKVRGKYRCEECNKLFKSYQALGGHRASHKKVRAEAANPAGGPKVAPAVKLHQCPFCKRVFSSGQALGGHKRSHFIGPGAVLGNDVNTGAAVQNSRNGEILNIDLNLPAPMDDEENSQIAVSAVSDAEFVHPIKL